MSKNYIRKKLKYVIGNDVNRKVNFMLKLISPSKEI